MWGTPLLNYLIVYVFLDLIQTLLLHSINKYVRKQQSQASEIFWWFDK